jgi:hypothetical protein
VSQQINLFNPIFLKQKKVFTVVPMAQALGVLLLGSLVLVYYGNRQVSALARESESLATRLTAKQARMASVDAEFAPRKKSEELEAELAYTQAHLQSLREVSGILKRGDLGNTRGYAEYFRAFSRQSIGGLWLTGVSITGAANEIALQGRALQASLIPNYISRLKGESVMQGKTFGSLEIAQPLLTEPVSGPANPGAVVPPAPKFVEFSLQTTAGTDAAVKK